ncbi:MAG: hemolysin III family protein [Bacillota bacterium]|nr:hemolysin III family protein [Bacillota bacterium]
MNIIKKTERVSFYSHFAGFLLAVAGTVYLMYTARHSILNLFVSTIYGASVILLFLASSLYHAFKKEEDEISIWRKLDHFAIFVMIAGTYTPVTIIYLTGYWRWIIIGIQWALVLGGFFFKFFYLQAPRWFYTLIYLLMGWVGIIPIRNFFLSMPINVWIYMLSGGILFSIGSIFYLSKRPKNKFFGFHEIFHIFILFGAIAHYLMVLRSVY